MCNCSSLSLFTRKRLRRLAGSVLCVASSTAFIATSWASGDHSWTAVATSPPIQRQGQPVSTPYPPGKAQAEIPAGSHITQVYANRSYAGNAIVNTQLCWNGSQRCVALTGQHLNTTAFNGLDPNKPMYLIHTVASWGPSFAPLYVVGNVNVWYTPPPLTR